MPRTKTPKLPLGYRMHYGFRRALLTVFGPAQLSEELDPIRQLQRERAAKQRALEL
jgi:hypothetical protein